MRQDLRRGRRLNWAGCAAKDIAAGGKVWHLTTRSPLANAGAARAGPGGGRPGVRPSGGGVRARRDPTTVQNLFVVPATIELAGAEIELVPAFSRELKLRRALAQISGAYDFTLIDCPPSLGLLTVNGLAASDDVIVPIQCEYYALEGLGQLLRNVALVKSNLNPALEVRGIVLTMYDASTKLAEQVESEDRTHYGGKVHRN